MRVLYTEKAEAEELLEGTKRDVETYQTKVRPYQEAYDIFGIEFGQTMKTDEMKKCFRAASLKHHPDRNGGTLEANEMMKQVNIAYDLFSGNGFKLTHDSKEAEDAQKTWQHAVDLLSTIQEQLEAIGVLIEALHEKQNALAARYADEPQELQNARGDAERAAETALDSKNELDTIKSRVAGADRRVLAQVQEVARQQQRIKEFATALALARDEERRLRAIVAGFVLKRVTAKKTADQDESNSKKATANVADLLRKLKKQEAQDESKAAANAKEAARDKEADVLQKLKRQEAEDQSKTAGKANEDDKSKQKKTSSKKNSKVVDLTETDSEGDGSKRAASPTAENKSHKRRRFRQASSSDDEAAGGSSKRAKTPNSDDETLAAGIRRKKAEGDG